VILVLSATIRLRYDHKYHNNDRNSHRLSLTLLRSPTSIDTIYTCTTLKKRATVKRSGNEAMMSDLNQVALIDRGLSNSL
jgi:hypothetical protein